MSGHVFHFCRVWGSRHGGSIYSEAMVKELRQRGWRVTLLAERFEEPTEFQEKVCLQAFFRRDVLAWRRRALEALNIWSRVMRTPRALVIVQGDLPRIVYLFLQLRVPLIFIRQDGILTCPANNRWLRRSRSVCRQALGLTCLRIHEDCLEPLSATRRAGRLILRLRDRALLRQMRHFVASSQYLVRAHGRPGVVLYPPRLTACAFEDLTRDLRRVIFCGRLEEVKGAVEALRILRLLPAGYVLEILGEGPERERLSRTVQELQVADRVRLHGWVDAQTRDRWLASAGVLLMPSLCDEAFGMAGPEAFAQGTPVVAYDVGGVSEWCRGQAGVLVRCGDIRRAAVAVCELTQDPGRWAAHSRAARRVAEEDFPVERFGRELDAVMRTVLGGATCGAQSTECEVMRANAAGRVERFDAQHGGEPHHGI